MEVLHWITNNGVPAFWLLSGFLLLVEIFGGFIVDLVRAWRKQ